MITLQIDSIKVLLLFIILCGLRSFDLLILSEYVGKK